MAQRYYADYSRHVRMDLRCVLPYQVWIPVLNRFVAGITIFFVSAFLGVMLGRLNAPHAVSYILAALIVFATWRWTDIFWRTE